jgi:hypothetical protein
MSICFSDGLTNLTVFTYGFILLNHLTVDYHNIHFHLQTFEINKEKKRKRYNNGIFDFSVEYSIFPKN